MSVLGFVSNGQTPDRDTAWENLLPGVLHSTLKTGICNNPVSFHHPKNPKPGFKEVLGSGNVRILGVGI